MKKRKSFQEKILWSLIRNTFEKSSKIELGYNQLLHKTHLDVLDDSYDTALVLALRGKKDEDKFEKLNHGIRIFTNFISEGKFVIEDAILCASHVAYLTQTLKSPNVVNIKKFNPSIDLSDSQIIGKYNQLNKLKGTDPEAFFYFLNALSE